MVPHAGLRVDQIRGRNFLEILSRCVFLWPYFSLLKTNKLLLIVLEPKYGLIFLYSHTSVSWYSFQPLLPKRKKKRMEYVSKKSHQKPVKNQHVSRFKKMLLLSIFLLSCFSRNTHFLRAKFIFVVFLVIYSKLETCQNLIRTFTLTCTA